MTTSTGRQVQIYVAVHSPLHTSAELAAILGMAADEAWDNGSSFTLGTNVKQHAFSRWAVVESDGDIEDWRATAERLIARVRPIESAFRRLPQGVYVGFSIFITEDNDVFGFGLDKQQVEFMAGIGAELDMSFVVSSPRAQPP